VSPNTIKGISYKIAELPQTKFIIFITVKFTVCDECDVWWKIMTVEEKCKKAVWMLRKPQ